MDALNERQKALARTATSYGFDVSIGDEDPKMLVIDTPDSTLSKRQIVAYQAGVTLVGMKVAIIDPSVGLLWITQRDAYSLITNETL